MFEVDVDWIGEAAIADKAKLPCPTKRTKVSAPAQFRPTATTIAPSGALAISPSISLMYRRTSQEHGPLSSERDALFV